MVDDLPQRLQDEERQSSNSKAWTGLHQEIVSLAMPSCFRKVRKWGRVYDARCYDGEILALHFANDNTINFLGTCPQGRESGLGAYSNSIVVGLPNPHTLYRQLIQAAHLYVKNNTSVL